MHGNGLPAVSLQRRVYSHTLLRYAYLGVLLHSMHERFWSGDRRGQAGGFPSITSKHGGACTLRCTW